MPERETSPKQQAATTEAMKRIGDCIRRRGSVLDLSGLGLTALPIKIAQLAQLTELDLADNRIEALPPELCQFSNLTRLNLSRNPLAPLSPSIGQLVTLTRLDLSHTPLRVLPPELCLLTNLTRLYLDHNQLEALPADLANLGNLTRLHLSHNALKEFPPGLSQLAKLTRLDISHNHLEALPPEIGQLTTLSVLDLSHNPLRLLPPETGQLARLTVLRLSHTRLTVLPTETGRLDQLTELDLTDNALAILPEGLRDLKNLQRLFLHDNPALQLSPSLLGPDPRNPRDIPPAPAKSILDLYFGRLSGKTRPLGEARIMLLGRSGAGKSSIAQALRDLPFRERELPTPGLALSDWNTDGSDGHPMTAHLWDFSGDPVTDALHPNFFSPRCLYLLVITGRDHHELEDADHWLGLIQAHGTDDQGHVAPVIVALNQWNVPGCRPEVDRIALRQRYPFIRGFVEMDCKAKKGIPALRTALIRELDNMPWVREPFPEEWDAVRHALDKAGNHITAETFRELCLQHGVTEQGQQTYLLELLHHLGAILHDQPGSMVIRPEWLARHLYPLLHRARHQDGILQEADVEAVLLAERDEADRAFLMHMLERFGLAHAGQSASGGIWLLPHAQPDHPPATASGSLTEADATRLKFDDWNPSDSPIPGIILKRYDFIDSSKERKLQWSQGVVLSRKGARAVIRINPQDRQVTITITGPANPRDQLAALCQAEMDDLRAAAVASQES